MTKIPCPRCKGHNLTAFRLAVESKDDINDIDRGGEWEHSYPSGKTWINCDDCGHSWNTTRHIP